MDWDIFSYKLFKKQLCPFHSHLHLKTHDSKSSSVWVSYIIPYYFLNLFTPLRFCFLNRQLQMFYFQVYLFLHDWDDCYLFKLFNPIITFCSLEIVFFNDFYCTIHISCSFFVFVKYFSPLFLFAVCWLVFYWVYYDYFWIICQAINSFNLLLVASVHEFLRWGYICLTSPDICRIVLSLSWMKLIKFFSLSRLVS